MTNKPLGVAASHLEPRNERLQFAQIVTDGISVLDIAAAYAPGDVDLGNARAVEDQVVHGLARLDQADLYAVDAGSPQVVGAVLERPVVSELSAAFGGLSCGIGGLYAHAVLRRAQITQPACILVIEDDVQLFYANPLIDDPCADGAVLAMDAGPYVARRAGDGAVNDTAIVAGLRDAYFKAPAPKAVPDALRRHIGQVMSDVPEPAQGPTAMGLVAAMVARGMDVLPTAPSHIYVAGPMRQDQMLYEMLNAVVPAEVHLIDRLDVPGVCFTAQAMGFAAARAINAMPIASSGTSGLPAATGSARIWRPKSD